VPLLAFSHGWGRSWRALELIMSQIAGLLPDRLKIFEGGENM